MLLIDHRHCQRPEGDIRLDQRVRAHQQSQLAASQLAQSVLTSPRRRRAGQQRGGHLLAADQPLQSREVLLGQRLGRRHQRGLHPVLNRSEHRIQGHHRLPAAHLPHQQPLHRAYRRQLFSDRLHRPALISRQRERQALPQPALAQPRRLVQPVSPRAFPPPRASSQEHQLRQQQLLKCQPLAAFLTILGRMREVHRR